MRMNLGEYPVTYKEGVETPTVLSGRGQRYLHSSTFRDMP